MCPSRRKLGDKKASVIPLIFWRDLSLTSPFSSTTSSGVLLAMQDSLDPTSFPTVDREDEYITLMVGLNDLKGFFQP